MMEREGSRTPAGRPQARDTAGNTVGPDTAPGTERHHRDPLAWLGAHAAGGWHALTRMWHRPGSWHRPLLIAVELLGSAVGAPFLAGLVTDLLVGDWNRKVGACGTILLLWILIGNIRGAIRKHREYEEEGTREPTEAARAGHSRRGAGE